MSENQTGIIAYDLEPALAAPESPVQLLPLFRDRVPDARGRPVYVPAQPPEGTVRVVLDSAGCNGEPADFQLHEEHSTTPQPHRVFDVPREQYERWRSAKEAFGMMEDEIEKLTGERARLMHAQVRERLR